MSLQPSDGAAGAFERLRSEVALLRRAVEGLAADIGETPVDYSPTLAELTEAVAEVNAHTSALGERPLLALAPEQLGSLFQIAAAKVLARPVAELEREHAALRQGAEALQAARQFDLRRAGSWRRTAGLVGGGALAAILFWSLLLGPMARALPAAWGVPERLASATMALPPAQAGDQLLRRGDPQGYEALQVVRRLSRSELNALQACLSRPTSAKSHICTVKLSSE